MRIAVVNNFFPPRPGGSAHLSEHLARAYADEGHDVLVLTATYGDAPSREDRHGFRVVRLPAWTLPKTRFAANFDIGFTLSPRAVSRVYRELDSFRPDVIHQHGQFFDLTWMSGLWARSRGVPTLLSIHTRLESPLSRFNSFVYWAADRMMVAPLMRLHRPRLVVMDALMRRYIEKRYPDCFDGTEVIPVGIDPEALRGGDGSRARAELGAGDRHIVLSLGHVIPQRSRIALAQALPEVLRRFPETLVVVIGGLYHTEFLDLAKELGVDHAIRALGARPQRDIPDFLAAADVEVHELEGMGFGTASLEALAVGVPVIAAVRADNFIDTQIVDERDMYLIGFEDARETRADPAQLSAALIKVLSDPVGARERMGPHARSFVADSFTIAKVAARHLHVLDELVQQNATDRAV